jgi:hypothetical protein
MIPVFDVPESGFTVSIFLKGNRYRPVPGTGNSEVFVAHLVTKISFIFKTGITFFCVF